MMLSRNGTYRRRDALLVDFLRVTDIGHCHEEGQVDDNVPEHSIYGYCRSNSNTYSPLTAANRPPGTGEYARVRTSSFVERLWTRTSVPSSRINVYWFGS